MTTPQLSILNTGSLWTADVVSPNSDPRRYLVVADDGYTAGVRARQAAHEDGVTGRHLEVYSTHVTPLDPGVIRMGAGAMRVLAADRGVDLGRYDSSRLPAIYVTPYGLALEAAEAADLALAGDDGE